MSTFTGCSEVSALETDWRALIACAYRHEPYGCEPEDAVDRGYVQTQAKPRTNWPIGNRQTTKPPEKAASTFADLRK